MKTRVFLIVLQMMFFCNVCRAQDYNKSYDIKDFTEIVAYSFVHVTFTQGDEYAVSANANADVLDKLKVSKKGKSLKIDYTGKTSKTETVVNVVITAPTLLKLELNGAPVFYCHELKSSEPLILTLHGASNLKSDMITCESLEMNADGAVSLDTDFNVQGLANFVLAGAVQGFAEVAAEKVVMKNSGAVNLTMKLNTKEINVGNAGAVELTLTGKANRTRLTNSGASTINSRELNRF